MERPLSTNVSEERLNRALTAFLRQELQAPATAITDFLDIIIEDASRGPRYHLLPDLERMRTASHRLNAFVKDLVQDTPHPFGSMENLSKSSIVACATI
jgi:signal transduction histidine kinase